MKTDRIQGIDSIRFIAAFWVLMTHIKSPLAWSDNPVIQMVSFYAFTGTPAVIVFFVISGFCIHYPYTIKAVNPWRFYQKRGIRIGIPCLVTLIVSQPLHIKEFNFVDGFIFWSLLCELIYYAFYPILRQCRLFISWEEMFALSFGISILCIATHPVIDGWYCSFGPYLNWLVGFPCWLLGCLLAEKCQEGSWNPFPIWFWRTTIWGTSSFLMYLQKRGSIGGNWTLNFFAILVFFWLYFEIEHRKLVMPWRFLENLGLGSYSLYLFHIPAYHLCQGLFFNPSWICQIIFILGFCYVFYQLVEKPTHQFVKTLGKKKNCFIYD
jgi:peptidoglycan/LPS O-acetylase OafA/YrhL